MSNLKSIKVDKNTSSIFNYQGPTTLSPSSRLQNSNFMNVNNNIVDTIDLSPSKSSSNLLADLSVSHKANNHTSNSDKHVNLQGTVSYDNSNMIYVKPDTEGCNQMAGACENEDYLIVSYKESNDETQKIVVYDKKTNKPVSEFITDKFAHSNALTIKDDTVYVVSTDNKVCSFSLKETLFKCNNDLNSSRSGLYNFASIPFRRPFIITPEITESVFKIGSTEEDVKYLTSLAYDPKTGVTVTGCGDKLFIVKDGKLTAVKKFDYSNQFAQTN